jgi:hypothetical protein
MKTTLYVITNISMPSLCKVGITDNLERRLNDLNKTGVPTRFQVYESFELENAELLEQEVLKFFAEKRLNRRREFIEEHPERVCDFIREHKGKVRQNEQKALEILMNPPLSRDRTCDLLLKRELLYRLSYRRIFVWWRHYTIIISVNQTRTVRHR